MAGSPDRFRGFGVQGGNISGHGEFSKVRPSGVVSPALALTVASAALGAYWQQQVDSTLRDVQGSLRDIQQRLDHKLDSQLDLAEQTLMEHEATPPSAHSGRY